MNSIRHNTLNRLLVFTAGLASFLAGDQIENKIQALHGDKAKALAAQIELTHRLDRDTDNRPAEILELSMEVKKAKVKEEFYKESNLIAWSLAFSAAFFTAFGIYSGSLYDKNKSEESNTGVLFKIDSMTYGLVTSSPDKQRVKQAENLINYLSNYLKIEPYYLLTQKPETVVALIREKLLEEATDEKNTSN